MFLLAALFAFATSAQPVLPILTNVVAAQRPDSFLVDVTYDLIDPDSPGGVYILAEASSTGGSSYGISMRSLYGDVGYVTPGTGKKIVWNAWNDWARNYTTNAKVRLIADDFPSTVNATNIVNPTTNSPPSANFVWIPSGTYLMGGSTYVWLTRGLWMSKFEVTQAEYEDVMATNPSSFTGNPHRPVETVSWYDATAYCTNLTARERAAGRLDGGWTYRLPTEAEWEYACRAGTTTTYFFGEDPYGIRLGFYAWYMVNAGGQTQPVESRAPNRWGLYDMHGNVVEWCQDWYGGLPGGNVTDPQGPSSGTARMVRGGSWNDPAGYCNSSFRNYWKPSNRYTYCGFRVVLAPVQ